MQPVHLEPEDEPSAQPIQVVARRTGVSPELLRAWERRYQVVAPSRSESGRRLYSATDIERLRLVRMASESGRRVGELAVLSTPELERLVAEDALARRSNERKGAPPLLEACRRAVEAFDDQALASSLKRASIELSIAELVDELIVPLMEEIGRRWSLGELTPAHEHLATAAVTAVLLDLTDSLQAGATGPRLVVAAPAGQRHEIGSLIAALAALLEGCRTTYLGCDLPADDVARAALKVEAATVVLSLTVPDAGSLGEIRRLSRSLGGRIPLLVGGQAVPAMAGELAKAGALPVSNLPALRQRLRDLA